MGFPVESVGFKTLLGAELELKLMRVVAEMLLNLRGEEVCGAPRHAVLASARGTCGVCRACVLPPYAAWATGGCSLRPANLTVDYIFTEDSLVCPFIGLICN